MNDAGTLMRACLEAFVSTDTHLQGKRLRQLAEVSPRVFATIACALMRDVKDTQSYRYLLALLNSRGLLINVLRMLSEQDPGAAGAATNLAMRLIPGFDRLLSKGQDERRAHPPTVEIDPDEFLRSVLETVDSSLQLLGAVDVELRMNDPRIRSRMSMLAGRIARLWEQFGDLRTDPDARVRANAVESLWGLTSPLAMEVFEHAIEDPHHRVRANALVGLYLQGEQKSLPHMVGMGRDPDATVRAAAAWAMGRTGDARFEPVLQELRRAADRNPMVIRNALLSISRLQRAEAASPHEPLRIALLSSAAAMRSISVTLHIANAEGQPIDRMRGTHVQLWSGGLPVWNYRLAKVEPEVRPVCVLLPFDSVESDDDAVAWSEAVSRVLACRPDTASWAMAGYASNPPAREKIRTGEILHLSDSDAVSLDTSSIDLPQFHSNTEALMREVEEFARIRTHPLGPLRLAVRQANAQSGQDLLLVVPALHSSLASARAADELRAAAAQNDVRLHMVLGPEVPTTLSAQLRAAAHSTGGWSLAASDRQDAILQAGTLLSALCAHWRVDAELLDESGPLELRVRTGRHSGVLTVADTAAHRAA